jgi:hypothetical protein
MVVLPYRLEGYNGTLSTVNTLLPRFALSAPLWPMYPVLSETVSKALLLENMINIGQIHYQKASELGENTQW